MSRRDDRPWVGAVSAFGITSIYFVVSAIWILFSDRLLATGQSLYLQLQTAKGWLFVAASSGLIYALVARREAELAEQNDQLKRALQQISILHRILRHNLRNSCNVINGYLDVLKDRSDDADAEVVAVIDSHVDDLIRLGEKSHLLRTIVLGGSEAVEPIELTSFLRERLATFEASHPNVVVESDLPDEQFVNAHRRLDAGLDELLENAAKHNDSSPPRVRVSVDSTPDDTVRLDIADNGRGIPDIERAVVELGEERPLFHSQGIGLWIASASVVESGGEIDFLDNEPSGSIARIRLPKAAPVS